MRVVSVVGARPQFVKLAPVARAMLEAGVEHRIVHTGQHYDPALSGSFFDELSIPPPDINLGVGSGSHGAQTGAMMSALDPVLTEQAPDWVLVYGDTNSTLAAAVCAAKLQLPLAHLEAGLRSFNRAMPEEHNRVLTDHAADLCLAPSQAAVQQLAREGLSARTQFVGDVMVDLLLEAAAAARSHTSEFTGAGEFVLATIHRAENTDDAVRLRRIVDALAALSHKVILPMHPRLQARCESFGITVDRGSICPRPPLSYAEVVSALLNARAVITDSGGLQKEAFVLGVPAVTVRTETEWTETLDGGWNVLVPDPRDLSAALERARPVGEPGHPYGDGRAAAHVVDCLKDRALLRAPMEVGEP